MNKEIKNCANIVKCVGTISELNLEFHPKDNNIIIRGSVVLLINNEYIRFNIFTSKKMKQQYYSILETFGIPYSFISSIDKDSYTINIEPITIGMFGSVKIMNDKIVVSKVDFNRTKFPTKLFIISNVTEYGNQSTYIACSNNKIKDYISTNIQGIIHKIDDAYITVVIPSNDEIKIVKFIYNNDILSKITIGSMYDLDLVWDKGYEINDNIVSNVTEKGFKIIDVHDLEYEYDTDAMKNMIKIYEIRNNKS